MSTLTELVTWGVTRVRHNYGLERDINHLKNDVQALSKNMNMLTTELERRLDTVERELEVDGKAIIRR
ncbi:MAG: hypothetical protein AAGA83_21580 [Cyanobacteria bacterium P01_F01_bin.116]